jgi:hypothetical protein
MKFTNTWLFNALNELSENFPWWPLAAIALGLLFAYFVMR